MEKTGGPPDSVPGVLTDCDCGLAGLGGGVTVWFGLGGWLVGGIGLAGGGLRRRGGGLLVNGLWGGGAIRGGGLGVVTALLMGGDGVGFGV